MTGNAHSPAPCGRGNSIRRRLHNFAAWLAMAVIALGALSACGKKGDLDPPDGKPDKFPKQYPDPSTL